MKSQTKYSAIVADDSKDIQRLVKRALEVEGITCDMANDGVEVLDRMKSATYDIVIADLRMPRMHGHKLMIELFDQGVTVPFVVITGVSDPRIIRDLYNRGAVDVIVKPFNFTALAVRVRHYLDHGRNGGGSSGGESDAHAEMSRKLESTATFLQKQLSDVTSSFQTTINELHKQREDLEVGYLGSVRVLANLMEQVGQSTGSHTVRVETAAIAKQVSYPAADMLHLKIAALLHEIGAFGMPDAIRMKPPWALDPEEREHYERYPEIGATFLDELKNGKPIVELVENHAENFDGTGFPDKKKGRDVPLGARILRIADGADTFLMHCQEENKREALEVHLKRGSGKLYDPRLVPYALAHFGVLFEHEDTSFALPVEELRTGLVLAENIYDNQGRFLAREGVELTPKLVEHIQKLLGGQSIQVREPEDEES